ncbi:MAG TPA: outer membrane beta-barrel protein [Xanthobacteraceae bacterium]|nr:outer membrane beta-barrel protein [Xanthobacteraceae bacterium]
MKVSVISGVVIAIFSVSSAFAGNFGSPSPRYAATPYNWTGCYGGIGAGGGYHSSSLIDFDGLFAGSGGGGIGAVAGGQVGCNYQINQFVVGAEAEGYWSDLNTKLNASSALTESYSLNSNNTYDASAALRVGYAFNRLLAYAKAGLAVGGFNWSVSETELTAPGFTTHSTASQTLAGLLLGVGFEYALTDHVSTKVEYDYMNFGDPTIAFAGSCTGAGCGASISANVSETSNEVLQMVKVGLNYKFY